MTGRHVSPESAALGRQIRAARHKRGWTIKQLADKAGVTPGALTTYETGTRNIPYAAGRKIAAALGGHLEVTLSMDPPPVCAHCGGCPPPGFTCDTCNVSTPKAGPCREVDAAQALSPDPTLEGTR